MISDRVNRLLDRVEQWTAAAAILLLVLIMCSVCLEIILRYFFNRPQVWVVELTEYGLLYITFLGSAWVLRSEGHVQVNLLVDRLSPRWQAGFGMFSSLLGVVVSLVLMVFGAIVTWDHFIRGVYKPTLLEFPGWIVLLPIPLGSLLLATRFLRRFLSFRRRIESRTS